MKKIINEEGFTKAMEAGKNWMTLDCQLSELENGNWYWEIEHTTFFTLPEGKKDGKTIRLGYGEVGTDLTIVERIWDNLIEKHNPDEYFVDQHNYEKIDL